MRRASPIGRGAEGRGGEGCIRHRNVSNDFFIPPLTCSAGALPKGEPHVEKRNLRNRFFASSRTIQGRSRITSSEAGGGSKPPPYGQRRRFRKSHVEKRSLQNRISASSHIIQGRSLIAPPQVVNRTLRDRPRRGRGIRSRAFQQQRLHRRPLPLSRPREREQR